MIKDIKNTALIALIIYVSICLLFISRDIKYIKKKVNFINNYCLDAED